MPTRGAARRFGAAGVAARKWSRVAAVTLTCLARKRLRRTGSPSRGRQRASRPKRTPGERSLMPNELPTSRQSSRPPVRKRSLESRQSSRPLVWKTAMVNLAERRPRRGRPTKFRDEIGELLFDAFVGGATRAAAARLLGLHPATLYRWAHRFDLVYLAFNEARLLRS